jgi:hypothetical protein
MKPGKLWQRIKEMTPLQHNALQRALIQRQEQTGICVRGSGMLTPLQLHYKGALESAQNKLPGICVGIQC